MLTRKEVAERLGVSVRWLANEGRKLIPSYRIGNQIRYDEAELENWLRQQAVEPQR